METLKRFGADPESAEQIAPSVGRFLAFGYYDGATDGVMQLADHGPVFRFDLPADMADGAAVTARERPFDLCPLPDDALDRLADILAPYSPPKWPGWFVAWEFATDEIEREVDAQVAAVLADAGPPAWRLTTPDPWNFATIRVQPMAVSRSA